MLNIYCKLKTEANGLSTVVSFLQDHMKEILAKSEKAHFPKLLHRWLETLLHTIFYFTEVKANNARKDAFKCFRF